MGRGQAMATAALASAVATVPEPTTGRTLLWWFGGSAWAFSRARSSKRRKPSCNQFLPMVEEGTEREGGLALKFQDQLLREPRALQFPDQEGPCGWRRGGGALLLFESDRLQRTLPIQRQRPLQRSLRP